MNATIKTKIQGIIWIMLFCFTSPAVSNAQANCSGYTIVNNLSGASCVITINYKYVCTSPFSVCQSGTNVVINGAGGSLTLAGCAGCGNCEVQITLTDVNGTPINPPVTVSGSNPTGTFPVPPYCSGGSGTISWSASSTAFN